MGRIELFGVEEIEVGLFLGCFDRESFFRGFEGSFVFGVFISMVGSVGGYRGLF